MVRPRTSTETRVCAKPVVALSDVGNWASCGHVKRDLRKNSQLIAAGKSTDYRLRRQEIPSRARQPTAPLCF